MVGSFISPYVNAEPLVIREQGSFAAGGSVATAPGHFDAQKPLVPAGKLIMAIMLLFSIKFLSIPINIR